MVLTEFGHFVKIAILSNIFYTIKVKQKDKLSIKKNLAKLYLLLMIL